MTNMATCNICINIDIIIIRRYMARNLNYNKFTVWRGTFEVANKMF